MKNTIRITMQYILKIIFTNEKNTFYFEKNAFFQSKAVTFIQ